MAVEVATASVRAFVVAVMARGHRKAQVSLYGGEPLLNQPVLHAVLSEVQRLREHFELMPILNTNGTMLTLEKAKELAVAGARVHVSIDGIDGAANASRVNRAGRPSLPAVITAIEHLRSTGCTFQINAMLTPANAGHLTSLVDFAREKGSDQIFLALPDSACTPVENGVVEGYAEQLLSASAWAASQEVGFFGPWGVGLHFTTRRQPWPPLNLAVKADGQVFFPHLPHRLLKSVEEALDSEAGRSLEPEWLETLDTCKGCELLEGCNGYLKMMVRYHTQSLQAAPVECTLARKVTAMVQKKRFKTFVTPFELTVRRADDGDVEIGNPLVADSKLIASPDMLEILNWFRRGGSLASLEQAFAAPNMEEVFEALTERQLLVEPGGNSDLMFLEWLAGDGHIENIDRLIVGARSEADMESLCSVVPHLCAAIERLPARLRPANSRFCVFAAADSNAMAAVLGRDPADDVLGWMAGTVWHSVVVLNLALCAGVLSHNGRKRTGQFVWNLTHEFCHIALRQAGIRLPLWLEEGVCEQVSGAQYEPERLALAGVHADDFVRFVLESSGETAKTYSLLEFSADPVDENPAYLLAHDFVRYLDRVVGLDCLLDEVEHSGLAALVAPFPMAESGAELLGLSLEKVLDSWTEDLRRRLAERRPDEKPLRILASGDRAVVYNRMVGGFVVIDRPPAGAVDSLLGRNLSLEEAFGLLKYADDGSLDLHRWQAGVFTPRRGYHLRLSLEDACNMSCSYCFEGTQPRRPMSTEVADRAVAAWRDLLRASDLPHSSIRFFGGEPFLNWTVMKHVLDTATQGLPPDTIKWTVNTNGTLLRTEQIKALKEKGNRMFVVLSCDGIGAANDKARYFRGGQGTFERVDRAACGLAEAGINLCIATVLGEHNAEGLSDLVRYVAGLRRQYHAPVYLSLEPMIGPAFSPQLELKIERAFFEAVELCRQESLPVSGKLFQAFESLLRQEGASGHFCAITGTELSVTADSTLRLCHAIPNSNYATLADVSRTNEIPLPIHVKERVGGKIEACSGCEVEGLCGGGCMAQSVRNTGSTFGSPGAFFCDVMTETFRQSVRGMLRLE